MAALLCALLLRVELFGLLHPREAWVESGRATRHAVAQGDAVGLDGGPPQASVRLPARAGRLRVRVPGLAPRELAGALEVSARAGELILVAALELEAYVAGVVEAELGPAAPEEAARALAIAARSFALARSAAGAAPFAHRAGAPLCDQTHCQLYQGRGGATARRAAEATAGEVLLLASGRVAPALHHAACGGRTASAREIWPDATPEDEEAGAAVDDLLPGSPAAPPGAPGGVAPQGLTACAALDGEPPLRWTLRLTEPQLARALGLQPPLGLAAATGPGGLLRRLEVTGLGPLSAEGVHLRLGRALGWDAVRSPRFTWEESPAASAARTWVLRGQGHGHGVGLCQRGATALSRTGWMAPRIIARYFPRLRVGRLPRGSDSR